MFPEIVRDDIFRIETRRMWLRWPSVDDAAAVTAIAGHEAVATGTAHVPHPYPKGEAARRIDRWRAKNASGAGLTLAMTDRTGEDRTPFGIVGLAPSGGAVKVGVLVAPERWGRGAATEAVQAMVDIAFALAGVPCVEAAIRVVNPAARRVVERCGFAYDGTFLGSAPARGGMLPFDGFRMDRKAWTSLKAWRMPELAPTRPPRSAPCSDGLCPEV